MNQRLGLDSDPALAFARAVVLLMSRGAGSEAWTLPYLDDPLCFLLDTITNPVYVRDATGKMLYCNRAASGLRPADRTPVPCEIVRIDDRQYERRCHAYAKGHFTVEVYLPA